MSTRQSPLTPNPKTNMKTPKLYPTYSSREYRVIALRDIPTPDPLSLLDTPDKAAEYFRLAIAPTLEEGREQAFVLILNTRRRITGYHLLSAGTLDTLLVHPRDVFRLAIMENAAALIFGHTHPSGDATPSGADISVTRDLIKAGQLLRIELLDSIIIGSPTIGKGYTSLRELGYWAGV